MGAVLPSNGLAKRARRRRLPGSCAVVAAATVFLGHPLGATGQNRDESQKTRQVQRELDAAWNAADWGRVEATLLAAWEADRSWARETCYRLASGEVAHARPLGAVVLGKKGSVRELAEAARSLDRVRFPDERRFLVRSIGVRAASEEDKRPALDAVRGFLGDQDFLVRSAAACSLADLKRPADVALGASDFQDPPAYKNTDVIDEREIFSRACYGALRAVANLRCDSKGQAQRWMAAPGRRGAEPVPTESTPAPGNWHGQAFFATPSFDVYFRIAGLKGAPADGPLAWPALPETAESAAGAASRAMGRVLGGPLYAPVIRLYICDQREFSARAGVTFFQGVTKSNEIVIKADPPGAMAGTLAHEYIHYLQANAYKDQPRWLAEGLAMSLSESRRASVWHTRRPAGELVKMVERGIFSELVNWNSGGSSDSKEGARYSLAHIAIDFLRFGGFAVPEERLGFLMGRLSRRESATRALEYTYGSSVKELDGLAAGWLISR